MAKPLERPNLAPSWRWHWLQVVAAIGGAFVLAWMTIGFVRLAGGASYGFLASDYGDPASGLFVLVDPSAGPVTWSGLRTGDRIVGVDGVSAADVARFHDVFWRSRRPGDQMDLVVKRAGPDRQVAADALLERDSVTLYSPLRQPEVGFEIAAATLSALAILVVTVAVALLRPKEPAALPLLIVGITAALSLGGGVIWESASGEISARALQAAYLLTNVCPPGLVHVFSLMPSTNGFIRWLRRLGPEPVRRAHGGVAALYLAPVAVALLLLSGPPSTWEVAEIWFLVGLFSAIGVIVQSYRRPKTPLAQAQLRWVLWGLVIIFTSFSLYTVANLGLQVAGNLGTAIIYLLIAIFPFSIALAVLRYRLFDVDLVIRQTVIYASLSTLLISGYLGVTYALSQAAVGLAGPLAVTDGPAIAVIAALLMAIAASPIRRQLQDAVDRLVYHQRLVRRRFLADAVESLSQALPFGLLLRFMTVETPERLGLVGAWLAVPDSSILANQGDSNLPGPAAMLLARLGQTRRPSILSLEDVSSSAVASLPADDPLLSPWYRAGARLVVPLRASAVADSPDQVIGAWVLGGFRAGSLPDREDLEAFGRIGRQAAVLLDYARLSDEQVHQALVAQDLERARQIQARLLPTRVDGWPGLLEIAARLRPARETSGDFYDVFPLPGSVDASLNGVSPHPSLQIAVGDVAGKGLGAALVMALTQATLRTAGHDRAMSTRAVIPVGGRRASNSSDPVIDVPAPSPAETLAIASALLHRSVGPRDFVCCALAVVEEEFMPVQTGGEVRQIILRLANAGQIPPLLCRLGQVRELVPDGERLPLGVWPDLHYGELRLPLVPGDVVVFVTDGVPEAPAAAAQIGPVGAVGRNVALIPPRAPSEFFGFTRLASSAGHWATTATNAQGCLDGIWADAEAWSGARFDHDDMTLVVLRYSG